MLFYVANFQYLVTCIAFSTSKPFRKSIWTNYPFFGCIVFLFIFDAIMVFLPSKSGVSTLFNLLPFTTEDGVEHYSYRWWIFAGIVANSIMTYVAEILIIKYLTKAYDQKMKNKKERQFLDKMEFLRSQPVIEPKEHTGFSAESHKPVATEETVDVIR